MENFIKEFHPEIEKEYLRFARKNRLPETGTIVKSLRSGFGGTGGQILKVVDVDDNGLTLQLGDSMYFSKKENWWKELSIL